MLSGRLKSKCPSVEDDSVLNAALQGHVRKIEGTAQIAAANRGSNIGDKLGFDSDARLYARCHRCSCIRRVIAPPLLLRLAETPEARHGKKENGGRRAAVSNK